LRGSMINESAITLVDSEIEMYGKVEVIVKQFLKSKVFQRYVFSYLVIFFIPFIVMSVSLYKQSVNTLKKEIDQTNLNKMKQASELTYGRIKEMNQIAALITYDNHLTPYMVNHPFTGKDAVEKLGIYKSSTAIIDEIVLYYYNSPNLYSDRGYYAIDTLLGRVLGASAQQQDRFIEMVRSLKAPAVLPAGYFGSEDNKRPGTMLFICPIPPHDTNKNGAVMFFVQQSVFHQLIDNSLGDFEGNVFMLNDNKEMIASDHQGEALGLADVKALDLSRTGVRQTDIGERKHSVVTVHSAESGWTFVMAVPSAQYVNKVFRIPVLLLSIAGSLVIAGLLMALVFAVRQYRPINSLMNYVHAPKSKWPAQAPASVQDTVQQFIRNHDSLRERVSVQQPLVRDQCLLKILGGNLNDPEAIGEVCAMLGISFPHPYFFVVYISFDGAKLQDVKMKGELLKRLEARELQDAAGYGVELIRDNAVAIIVNSRREDAALTETAVRQLQELMAGMSLGATIGVGTVYGTVTQAHNSFIEASAAVDYKLTSGIDTVIYFKRHSESNDFGDWYTNDVHLILAQSLKKGNMRVALETAGALLRQIRTLQAPIDRLRCYCFDVINIVLRAAAGMPYSDPAAEKAIVGFASIEELEVKLYPFIEDACRKAVQIKEREGLLLGEQIIQYIHDHFKEYAFSLEKMAAHFQLSESYMSRFLKEKTGSAFLQYLWELRLTEVKKQLRSTDKTIRTIVQEIAYIDVPNFIRKFKKTVGMTPGEYRKKNSD
jgi:two-component system response regulator YesN